MEDRRRLFQLIQTIKAELNTSDSSAPAPAPVSSLPPTASINGNTVRNSMNGSYDPSMAFSQGYTPQASTPISAADARLSLGRRSGANVLNGLNSSGSGTLNRSRSLSNAVPPSLQMFQQQQQQQQQHQQQQLQHQHSQQMLRAQYQQQQQQQQQQLQQQQQQQQQLQREREQFLQEQQEQQQQRQREQYQHQLQREQFQLQQQQALQQQALQIQQQQQQQYQQQHQFTGGRNFKEASDEEDDPIPIQEAKQRGLDAYSVPTNGKGTLGRSTNGSAYANDMTAKIRVCVRKRPLNSKEIHRGEKDMATVAGRQLAVDEPKVRVDMTKFIERHKFIFDEVFDTDATNEDVYRRTAFPLVQYLFEGGKATCFAYGQTGSGKTFTMLDDKQGLYVLAARDIFVLLRNPGNSHLSVYIGFYEIYQGQLHDLLNNRKKLHAREDNKGSVVISGLKEYEIVNVEGLMQVFEYGNNARSTGSTNANADSSRSHAIMQIVLKDRSTKSVEGKLSFIDLAGSERGADRGETDVKTRMEGAEINKSLLALKECIRALDQDKKHTPFRQSKLTQVLKDSFVGNSRTCMVATISPNNSNSEHTLNTLRYADRVKELKSESGAKSAAQDQDQDYARDEYMDDAGDYEANDHDYMSSSGSDNIADEEIDLLDDEEFPHALDQEEMVNHPLVTSTYDLELEEPMPRQTKSTFDQGEDMNLYPSNQLQHRQSLLFQQQQQQQQQQHMESERYRDPTPTKMASPAQYERKNSGSTKIRKPEVSRLPTKPSSPPGTGSSIPAPQRQSLSSTHRRNSSNVSPPLGARTAKDSRSSPEGQATSSESGHQRTNSRGVGSPMMLKHPSVVTKRHGAGSGSASGSALSSLASPTSPKVGSGVTTVSSPSQSSASPRSATSTWSPSSMEEFVREHRAELQENGELTKRETKLLKNVMLGMSSPAMAQTTGYSNSEESFQRYLAELDEIIDGKMIAIVAISQKLKALRTPS
ncbi:Kinesin-like protein kif24 [Podila clonocystis]|nr:Kinesin-like protein kif24 [Podila clonocystis]